MAYVGDQKREYQRKWIAKRRMDWIKKNGPCVDCGTWDDLEVDHNNADSKAFNVSQLWSLSKTNPRRIEELEKCVVRCVNCHLFKTVKQHERSHGYKHYLSKLTEHEVVLIRRLFSTGRYTKRGLARKFNIDEKNVRLILTYKAWNHVK